MNTMNKYENHSKAMNAIENKPLPVYGSGKNIRDWIHVEDHSSALYTVMSKGKSGEVYNIGGNCEKQNIDESFD